MRKPQVEHLWNDITLTLVSPEGAIIYHLISILFFLMTRIQCQCIHVTPLTVVQLLYHTLWLAANSGANFMSVRLQIMTKSLLLLICSPVKACLCKGSVDVLTHIKKEKQKRKTHNTNWEINTVSEADKGIDLSLSCVIYEPSSCFRLHWPQKKKCSLVTVTGQEGNALVLLLVILFYCCMTACLLTAAKHPVLPEKP